MTDLPKQFKMNKKDTVNEIARKKFAELGLSYKDIGSKEFCNLVERLNKILPSNEFTDLKMKVSTRPKKYAPKINLAPDGSIKSAFIRCDSCYFTGREAISFNEEGFIGFAGWADIENTKPFTTTFIEWTEDIACKKEKLNGI